MQLTSFYNYYKVGRFIFALSFLVSFELVGLLSVRPFLLAILIVYISIIFVRLFSNQGRFFYTDFVLDIVVISSILYLNLEIYSFLTLFYLAPIFLASIMIKSKLLFLIPAIAALFYVLVISLRGSLTSEVNIINFLLHCIAFFITAFAGNSMKDKLYKQEMYIKKLEEEKIKSESYKRLYRVSADLIHEIRNPLTAISAAVQFLKEGKNNPDILDMLATETKRLTDLSNDFLLYSRPEDAPQETLSVAEVIKSIVASKDTNNKKLIAEIDSDALVSGNRTFLEVALANIIKNALEAAASSVIITLNKDKGSAIICVEDDGPGLQKGSEDRIFEPFFTTKKFGTGLGLAIANRIVSSMGGTITYGKSSFGGAKFSVFIPLKLS
ncbi:MAG: HAMP domain-containing histidine kinase [Thermodesulfovibrionales bacterium]|nr:HAMP domain-containing histidine kinase [Thermodesulfovibrionales bacterium]